MITQVYTGINPLPMFFNGLDMEILRSNDYEALLKIVMLKKGRVHAVYHPEAHIFPEEQAKAMARQAGDAIIELEHVLMLLIGNTSGGPGDMKLATRRFNEWLQSYLQPSKETPAQPAETRDWRWESLRDAELRVESLERQVRELITKLHSFEVMASDAVGKGTETYNAAMKNIEGVIGK